MQIQKYLSSKLALLQQLQLQSGRVLSLLINQLPCESIIKTTTAGTATNKTIWASKFCEPSLCNAKKITNFPRMCGKWVTRCVHKSVKFPDTMDMKNLVSATFILKFYGLNIQTQFIFHYNDPQLILKLFRSALL